MPLDLDAIRERYRAAIPADETMRRVADADMIGTEDDAQCAECGDTYQIEDGLEPVVVCDKCAQNLVVKYAKKLRQAEEDRGTLLDRVAVLEATYERCYICDHFVESNDLCPGEYYHDDPSKPEGEPGLARYIHFDDGEQEYDHDAKPSGEVHGSIDWQRLRPDLFVEHPDGKVGPNSEYHCRRGKADRR